MCLVCAEYNYAIKLEQVLRRRRICSSAIVAIPPFFWLVRNLTRMYRLSQTNLTMNMLKILSTPWKSYLSAVPTTGKATH